MSNDMKNQIEELYKTLVSLTSTEDCKDFFEDLCTYKEIEAMAQRLQAAKLLSDGETYEKIIEKTGISSATLSRVNKCVKYGNGYKKYCKK
ncbi:MAG: hypothetical protein IIX01_04325 [Clostridia bacterium]|nr:hypothetical protein [Clostridia bacterium]